MPLNGLLLATLAAVSNAVVSLPTVIVEASRLERSEGEIASHVEVISSPDIASSCARNTVELLEKRGNLFFRKPNANPSQAQVSMRGYGANGFGRVKILVDGEELNNPDMAPQDLMRVPLSSVRRVEIVHGPQTVLHGGDASAGVINIISDDDSYDSHSEIEAHGGDYGSVGAHVGTRGGIEEDSLTYYADFDYDRTDGWRQNTGYDYYSVKGGLKRRFANDAWWAFKSFYAYSRYGLPGGLLTGGVYGDWKPRARHADDAVSEARNHVYGFSISANGVIDDENSLLVEFSYRQRQSESYDYLDYDVHTFGYHLKYANTSTVFGYDNEFNLGSDLKHDLVYADAYNSIVRYGCDNNYRRFSGALFVRDELWVLDSLSFFVGSRGEWFNSRDRYDRHSVSGTDRSEKDAIAAEIGTNWHPEDGLKVFAKWSRFYHSPLADELFSSYGVPNLGLSPETGDNVEIGVDWSFLDDFNFSWTGYHAWMEDEIMYLNSGNCNSPDDTARTGFDTSLTWSRDKVGSVGIRYSYVYSRFTEGQYDGHLVPLVPGQQLRLFGEYYLIDWFAVGGGYRFVGEQRYGGDFDENGGMLPDYGLFDLSFRLIPEWSWLKGFTLTFAVDNLFDRRYCDYGEYFGSWYVYPATARTFTFTLRYEF